LDTASGDYAVVAGGRLNQASGSYSTVSGGSSGVASGTYSAIGGGNANIATGFGSFAVGLNNVSSGNFSTVSGGINNLASGVYSVIGGGSLNKAIGSNSVVSNGYQNESEGNSSAISGGSYNRTLGTYSTVSGGIQNTAYSYGEWVGGYNSTVYTPNSTTTPNNADKLFVIGNGSSPSNRSNALTLMKDGRLGLGVDGNAAQTATLHVKPTFSAIDPLRVEGINVSQVNDTSVLVTNPATGVIRHMNINSLGRITSVDHPRNDTLSIIQGNNTINVDLANTMAEIYDSVGGNAIGTSFTDISFGISGIVDANYTAATNTITVLKPGRYRISYRVTAEMVSGNNRSATEYRLVLNSVNVPGTKSSAVHRNDNISESTVTVTKVLQLSAGDIIKVQGRRYEGESVIETTKNGSSLLIEKL